MATIQLANLIQVFCFNFLDLVVVICCIAVPIYEILPYIIYLKPSTIQ